MSKINIKVQDLTQKISDLQWRILENVRTEAQVEESNQLYRKKK